MATLLVTRDIQVPAAIVFEHIANPMQFAEAVGGVTDTEFLTETRYGVGTRYRQTRVVNGNATTMEFEITECVANRLIRILNETNGVIWDTLFTIESKAVGTTLVMRMDARTHHLIPKLLLPLMIRWFVRDAVEKDIDRLRSFCEENSS